MSRLVRFFLRCFSLLLQLWRRRVVRAALLVLVGLWVFDHIVTLATDVQWHDSLGLGAAFRARWLAGATLFFSVLLLAVLLLLGTLRALRRTPKTEIELPPLYAPLQHWLATFERVAARLACLIIGLEAFVQARILASQSDAWLVFRHAVTFGRRDPFFGLDFGFYQLRLPFLHALLDVAARLTWGVLLVSVVLLAGRGVARWVSPRPEVPRSLARWCLGLGAVWFGLRGLKFAFWPLDLMFLPHPDAVVPAGMTFVDWNVRRPLAILGVGLCGLMMLLLLAQMFRLSASALRMEGQSRRAPTRFGLRPLMFCGLCAWLLPGFLNVWLPGLAERLIVAPDVLQRERPFLQAHLAATRRAWGLDRIQPALSNGAFDPSSVRLWDGARLGAVVLGQARPDELLSAPQLDRYDVNGKPLLVGISAREPHANGSLEWVNRHASSHTRADGVLLFDAASVAQGRAPSLSLPLPSTPEIVPRLQALIARHPLREASVSYGADEADYGLLEDDSAGGVALTSVWRRALWSWRLRDLNLLLRGATSATGISRLLLRPAMSERAGVLRFLVPDGEPCAVISDGQVVWMLSLLSLTPNEPLTALDAASGTSLGVPRDSVKMTMDAVTGRVAFYASSPRAQAEPTLRAWRRALPGLIQDASAMPAALRAHRRYPRGLFAAQMRILQRYGATPNEFAARQAAWRSGRAPLSNAPEATLEIAAPDYVLLPPLQQGASGKRASFALQEVLLSPPNAPDARLQIVRADCDGDNYGQLGAARFPLTPQAARAAAKVLAERAAPKAGTILGEPVVVAMGQKPGSESLLAWQPVFKKATGGTPLEVAPELLSGVVVHDLLNASTPGFGSSAAQALQLWRAHSSGAASVGDEGEENPRDLAQQALILHDQAQRAASGQDAGGWQRAGRLWKQEREVLRRLAERQNRPQKPKTKDSDEPEP